jgi:hypothetical protein
VSEPRKHHYVPVCYLKQWVKTDDRRLCEHKLIPGYGVKPRRTSPDGTGYQVDLYRIDGVSSAPPALCGTRLWKQVVTLVLRLLT